MTRRRDPRSITAAERADRYRLYECAVQSPRADIDFIDRIFRQMRGRSARDLREDFCGTAAVCCEWVRRRKSNRAWGVDTDGAVLAWALGHNLGALPPEQRGRVALLEADVRSAALPSADIIVALNCSYWALQERAGLLGYFRRVRESLSARGIFFLDVFGGYDSFRVLTEERARQDEQGASFTSVWEQASYEPITGRMHCHIHFRFPDGSEWPRAFSYEWRVWTLPEIRELLVDAGFSRILIYWQGWDENGQPDGQFCPVETGEPDASWIAYLSAQP
jgi:hypothetical protein